MGTPGRPPTGTTPLRSIRIGDPVWQPAKQIAAQRGETLTSVIERALRAYIRRHGVADHDTPSEG